MRILSLIVGLLMMMTGFDLEKKESAESKNLSKKTVFTSDTAQGIDISFYQKDISWWKVKNVHFVFIKATEGTSISDSKFKENWDSSKQNGILRGAYHFYRPYVSAKDQFRHFKSRVKLELGDLPPVLDIEVHHKYPSHIRREALSWLKLAESHYGVKPIIYCTYWFYKKYFDFPEFEKYPLWIANYVAEDLNTVTSDWHFWQHTSTGKIDGIRGDVDQNIFNGTYDSLLSLCKR